MRTSPPVRLDAEVIELLRDSPELLAIADAISATQAPPARRRPATRLAAVAFSQYRPVSKNRAKNRRIEIVLYPRAKISPK